MTKLPSFAADRGAARRVGLIVIVLLFLTALCATLMPMRVRAAACSPPPADYGTVTSTIQIDTAGTYRVWSRLMAPNTTANSYLLEIDGSNCYIVGDSSSTPANSWTWIDYQNGDTSSRVQQNMTAGSHNIKLIGREAGVKLDRVLFVTDMNCVPTGTGDNCATAGDTEAPSIAISTPADNATVSNVVGIKADASDNVGVSKVEFFVGGALVSTDTAAPYAYDWDSKTTVNGNVTLSAKAYDVAGNSTTDSTQVKVANGDTQAPTRPGGVTAQANAYNKVTVGWQASTDNVGVAGYWVSRDGTVLGKVSTGTQYVDNSVLPNTSYSYQVSAIDAAGNTSALSDAATTKTPNTPDTIQPSPPTQLAAKAVGASQINVSWNASTDNIGVANYEVYRTEQGGAASRIATVTSTSYGDTGLKASTAYSYYVIAKDAAGNASQKSATVSATTDVKPPTNQKKTGTVKGKVTLDKRRPATATVTIFTWGYKRITSTDSKGNYALHDVPAGSYLIQYRAPGYHREINSVKVRPDKTHTKNVRLYRR
jgi:fibronectin type 3 domain-containing protein